ncbi:glycosyltransferase [bacterium]|nr:glycosyltransferase [bacterium]
MTQYILDARTATAHFPGIGRYVRNLATAMAPQLTAGEQLAILWNQADTTAWDPTPLTNTQVTAVPARVSPFSIAQQITIPRLLKQLTRPNPQSPVPSPQSPIFHSTYYLMPYRPGLPTLLTVYDLIAMRHPETVSPRARLLFRLTTQLALRAADHVVTISDATRRDLLAHFPVDADHVTAIPLAADPRFTPQTQDAVVAVRRKYSLPSRFIFYLGINKPHKNLIRLVDAYARLTQSLVPSPQSPVPNLVIAGAWDERYPEARDRSAALNLGERVRFLGRVDDADLPALYSACTLFVFPSVYEGFGLPVLEAMACGAPVACGDASSLPEAAGEAALLFDPRDEEAIADALRRALEDDSLRRTLADRSLQQARCFSWQRTAAETLSCYRELVGK